MLGLRLDGGYFYACGGCMENRKSREFYIELLRIICIFLVIYNHTRDYGYSLYQHASGADYWLSANLTVFCKIAVPIFFMISGVTLLAKEESLKDLYLKRVLRFVLVILLFTLLQYLRMYRVNPEGGFHISTWLLYSYSGNIIEPYWYLKSYLAFLLILPFLRVLAKNMENRHFEYLIWLKIAETVTSTIHMLTGYLMNVQFPLGLNLIFYPLIGYYLAKKCQCKWKRSLCFLLAIVVTIVTVFGMTWFNVVRGEFNDGFLTNYTWLIATMVFIGVKDMQIREGLFRQAVLLFGPAVFGAYLIEDVIRNQFVFLFDSLPNQVGSMTTAILFSLISTVVALIVARVMKWIPGLNKLI